MAFAEGVADCRSDTASPPAHEPPRAMAQTGVGIPVGHIRSGVLCFVTPREVDDGGVDRVGAVADAPGRRGRARCR